MSNQSTPTEVIETSTSKKIVRFLNGTARHGQFSYMFGPTGRGKTFVTRDWIARRGNAAYVRAFTGVTQTGLRKQISRAIFGDESARESEILQYLIDHPGFVLVIDEANHLLTDGNLRSVRNLDSIRDYYDSAQEAGGKIGVVFIFTEYSLERLRKCRIASFLKQFINRGDNHLAIPSKISRAYEVVPILNSLMPGAVTDDLIAAARQFPDIRSLTKRIATAMEVHARHGDAVDGALLAGLQAQYESGDYSDPEEKE